MTRATISSSSAPAVPHREPAGQRGAGRALPRRATSLRWGFETGYVESAPERGSLIARFGGQGWSHARHQRPPRHRADRDRLDEGPVGRRDRGRADLRPGRERHEVRRRRDGVGGAIAVARSGIPRRGDLILMPTADESSGGRLGMGIRGPPADRPSAAPTWRSSVSRRSGTCAWPIGGRCGRRSP